MMRPDEEKATGAAGMHGSNEEHAPDAIPWPVNQVPMQRGQHYYGLAARFFREGVVSTTGNMESLQISPSIDDESDIDAILAEYGYPQQRDDEETVSSMSNATHTTDNIWLYEAGTGVLNLERPQPDEASIDHPELPNRNPLASTRTVQKPFPHQPQSASWSLSSANKSISSANRSLSSANNSLPREVQNWVQPWPTWMQPRRLSASSTLSKNSSVDGPLHTSPSQPTSSSSSPLPSSSSKSGLRIVSVHNRDDDSSRIEKSSKKGRTDEDHTPDCIKADPNDDFYHAPARWTRLWIVLAILLFVFALGGTFALVRNNYRGSASRDEPGSTGRDNTSTIDEGLENSVSDIPRITSPPTSVPSASPTGRPTGKHSLRPSSSPSSQPTLLPTLAPSSAPSMSPTVSPTLSPTLPVPERLLGLLTEFAPASTLEALLSSETHQSQAFDWLVDHTDFSAQSQERILQRFALATLYYGTQGQEGWEVSDGWLQAEDECTWWNQVENPCTDNESGLLTSLRLVDNNLEGQLPDELSLLPSLVRLDLAGNDLIGALPNTWSSLTKLQILNLKTNRLTGSIPASWGAWSRLRVVMLTGNLGLTGAIPIAWADSLDEAYLGFTGISNVATVLCRDDNPPPILWATCDEEFCPCCTVCCSTLIQICERMNGGV